MTRETEDDALRWEGDDDPTLAPGWKTVGPPVAAPVGASGSDAASDATSGTENSPANAADDVDADTEAEATAEADGDQTAPASQTGSVELVVLGILAGVYLLYTIGWLITALRTSAPGVSVVSDAMYVLGLWLAVLAAPCWFALALRAGARRRRLVWLVAGVIVLMPLPFVLGVTA